MKVSDNFDLREFVSPAVWKRFGANSRWFVNPWCIDFAQYMKDFLSQHYGEEVIVIINNWHYGGQRKWSCHRTYQYIARQIKAGKKPATLTQHIGGQANAIDFKVKRKSNGKFIPAKDIRKVLMENESLMMSHGLTCLEGDKWAPTWVHADNRPTGLDHILIVGDKK
jgi:hypothetical protein